MGNAELQVSSLLVLCLSIYSEDSLDYVILDQVNY